MPRAKSAPVDPVEARLAEVAARVDELVRLVAILVSQDRTLQDAVERLSSVGFKPTRISELLDTSPGYAKVAADRAKRKRRVTGRKAKT